MKLWCCVLLCLAYAGLAHAVEWLPVLPQNDVLPATLAEIGARADDLTTVTAIVEMGQGEDNPRWLMSSTHVAVMADLLAKLPDHPQPVDDLWPHLPRPEPKYKGIRLLLQTLDGKRFAPMTIFEGKITGPTGELIAPDYGRNFEYWLFGTARVRRDQILGAHVLPVLSFEQCRLLGQRIVYTTPRQCLLPDNNLLLESQDLPTMEAARVKDFDGCLKHGSALIYTFPRRCMTVGGRVFTEPPRVYDVPKMPADAPIMGVDNTTNLFGTPLTLDELNVAVSTSLPTP
jgi:hypothetical protein